MCPLVDAITEKLMVIIGFKPCLFNEKSVLIRKYIVVVEIFGNNRSTSVKRILPPFFANLRLAAVGSKDGVYEIEAAKKRLRNS